MYSLEIPWTRKARNRVPQSFSVPSFPWSEKALVLLVVLLFAGTSAARACRKFSVDDYFRLHRIKELAISGDGDWLVYSVETPSLDENRVKRQVYLLSLRKGATSVEVAVGADSHELAWIPGADEFAFLSGTSGTSQVYSYNVRSHSVRQKTRAADSIKRFKFAPDGSRLAYITMAPVDPDSSLFSRLHRVESGVLIDTNTTSLYDFVNPSWGQMVAGSDPSQLWQARGDGEASKLEVPGDVTDFLWSSDSHFLSIVYIASTVPKSMIGRSQHTSVGAIDIGSGGFHPLFEWRGPVWKQPGEGFLGGEWVPNRPLIVVRRVDEADIWSSGSFPQWTTVNVFAALSSAALWSSGLHWHGGETYHAKFFPETEGTSLVENTVNGVRSLFEWSAVRSRLSLVVKGIEGSSSLFSFSTDMGRAVFVNQSLTRPPEIYVWTSGLGAAQRVSQLNVPMSQSCLPRAEKIVWSSVDGKQVSGWLLEPDSARATEPLPLVTFVHGGPTTVVVDEFAPYFSYWPYPLEIYPEYGIAVFIPNYRGTLSFGREFSSPSRLDGEPVSDIISGIRYLVARGMADPSKLGIAGHSHGAWLGPVAMTRDKVFRATSFSEGAPNLVVSYELMDGNLNRDVQDVKMNGSLYDAPQRYIDASPDLHFDGVTSANLFEGAAESLAVSMLAYGKISSRLGLPTEMVVYPRSDHNLTLPRLQKESAERNLDWFRFWLANEVDDDPTKAEQYRRWRAMRLRALP